LQDLATQGRKWAVLGDMLELGVRTEEYHRSLGERIRELKLDFLITVGERAHHIAHAAISAGQDQSSIFEFAEASEAGRFLQDRIHERDIILIKGSRGVHLEVLVKEIMAEPQRAAELLVH
jgi:UDP-N-acetylmuramoyl-tripeptide--D-alanyl-D-alanine ligase